MNTLKKTLKTAEDLQEPSRSAKNSPVQDGKTDVDEDRAAALALLRLPEGAANL